MSRQPDGPKSEIPWDEIWQKIVGKKGEQNKVGYSEAIHHAILALSGCLSRWTKIISPSQHTMVKSLALFDGADRCFIPDDFRLARKRHAMDVHSPARSDGPGAA